MKQRGVLLFLLAGLFIIPRIAFASSQVFINSTFDNYPANPDKSAVSTGAGGNVGSYPNAAGTVPASGDIRLEQSAFGFMTACPPGFPNAVEALRNEAEAQIRTGTRYKTLETLGGEGQTGIAGLDGGAWDIRFPGARNSSTGNLFRNGDEQNYFEEKLLQAGEYYRVILQMNPYDTDAAKGLLQTWYERMVPLIFAANVSQVEAFRQRTTANSLSAEIDLLDEGIGFYQKAAKVFIGLTEDSSDRKYLDGSAEFVDHNQLRSPDTGDDMAIVPMLLETYARAVAYHAEAISDRVNRKYMAIFEYPVMPYDYAPKRRELVDYINDQVALIQHEVLVFNSYKDIAFADTTNVLDVTDIGKATQAVSDLIVRRDIIRDGDLYFTTGDSYGVYPPEFVPFFYKDPEGMTAFANSYQNLYTRAKEVVERAKTYEQNAQNENRQFDSNQQMLQNNLEGIRDQYYNELGEICGRIYSTETGELVPDVVYALFPPDERFKKYNYSLIGETAEGQLYFQWKAIEAAELEVEAAMMDLDNLVKEIGKKEEVAAKVADIQTNIAQLYLQTGEKLAALELQKGELNAKMSTIENRKKKWGGIIGSVISAATSVAASFINPASGISTLFSCATAGQKATGILNDISGIAGIAQSFLGISTSISSAKSKADIQRQLGMINAQQVRIKAFESAQIQLKNRDIGLLKTEEVLHSMILQAERLKLNILLAEQRADVAYAELARLTGRVGYLLQEWARDNYLITQNPINRPDYRLIRNLAMRDADDAFCYAQERCYLAAKAAEYRVNAGPSTSSEINSTISDIFKARRAIDVENILDDLNDRIENLQMRQGARQTDSLKISVRHFIVQNNYVIENSSGDIVDSQLEVQGDENGNPISSDEAWKNFLKAHRVYDADKWGYRFEFAFSTSLNRPNAPAGLSSGKRFNPLHLPNATGMLLSWNGDNSGQQNGVTINIRGRQLSLPNDRVRVWLRQEGSSAVRFKTWYNDSNGTGIRFWNLEAVKSNVTAAINGVAPQIISGDSYRPSTPQFHERSPANDRWVFTIAEEFGGANPSILDQIEKITDIEITFDVTYFTP